MVFASRGSTLPSSLPINWPNSKQEDIDAKPKRIISVGSNQEYYFKSNFVKTSKYEIWNFLPKFLLEEFNPRTKFANCYFLMISALQCVPAISNTSGYPTTLIPLLFVVLVDGLFQIFEDMSRHRADKEANSSISSVFNYNSEKFEETKWADIKVGDFIKITTRSTLPADVVIISVAEKNEPAQGICYVETKSLDGETNLKLRNALPNTLSTVRSPQAINALKGKVESEHPNKFVDSFAGIVDFGTLGRQAIQPTNILLRGCVLRNTDWAIGLVINTGHDTKIMMSSTETKGKTSALESNASTEIQRVVLLLMLVCFAGATGQAIWNSKKNVASLTYLAWDPSPVSYWFIKYFYFFLLHATFIPVSLYVSMAISRSFQSYFMNNDIDMYYERLDAPALVRTMTLNEELGQISHVFSDKTGTLTCNIMDFRKASINGTSYGVGITEIGKAAWKLQGKTIPASVLEGEELAKKNSVDHVSFYCPLYNRHIKEGGAQKLKINNFFRTLAICHDVIPEKVDGKIKLSASNPDDEALVAAAAYFGYKFIDRREQKYILIENRETGRVEELELLESIEFSSKRKRMSVIVKEKEGILRLYCKGADNVILDRLKAGQSDIVKSTTEQLQQYSIEGLRCLLVGYAEIDSSSYATWSKAYKAARTDLTQIEKKKKGESNIIENLEEQIEKDLVLIGSTAIEDKLQDGVPDCIANIVKAGVNIWMLTGDKEETAINIAVACNLVSPIQYMDHIIINKSIASTSEKMLEIFQSEVKKYDQSLHTLGAAIKPRALIIDGPSLITAMDDERLKEALLHLSTRCRAVVGCRVSPDQKRLMVNLIKTGVKGVRTLAIGDGANDVAMIQEAHIGVGIKGEEGLQAVNSSDFAIAQFRYLQHLMLKHGRYNYIRMSNLICYMFYKNVFMSIAQFWFNFNCGFSGQKYYEEGLIQLYNLAFTSFPILLLAVYDRDVCYENVINHPQLYLDTIKNVYFRPSLFWSWMLTGIFESVIASVVPLYLLQDSEPNTGVLTAFWQAGAACFTVVIIIVSMKMFFIQNRWNNLNFFILFLSVAFYFSMGFFFSSFKVLEYDWYYVFFDLCKSPNFWLTIILICTAITLKDIYFSGIMRTFNYKPYMVLQEIEFRKGGFIPRDEITNSASGSQVELKGSIN